MWPLERGVCWGEVAISRGSTVLLWRLEPSPFFLMHHRNPRLMARDTVAVQYSGNIRICVGLHCCLMTKFHTNPHILTQGYLDTLVCDFNASKRQTILIFVSK